MANAVIIKTSVAAKDVDAYNKIVRNDDADFQNGALLKLTTLRTDKPGETHVFNCQAAGVETGVWMAHSPEVTVRAGVTYGDPREFINEKGKAFDAIKLFVDDIFQASKDWFAEGFDPETVTGAAYAEIQADSSIKASASATTGFAGFQCQILKREDIVIGGELVPAWLCRVVQN